MTEPSLYAQVKTELGIDPGKPYVAPPDPSFTLFGYKKRRKLAGATSAVLRQAGLEPNPKG